MIKSFNILNSIKISEMILINLIKNKQNYKNLNFRDWLYLKNNPLNMRLKSINSNFSISI